jgi:hypothetical protein
LKLAGPGIGEERTFYEGADDIDMTFRLPTDECSIDALAGVLLRFCRDHAVIMRSIHDSPDELNHLTKWSVVFGRWFKEDIDSDVLTADDLATLGAKVRDALEALAPALKDRARAEVLLARAVAEALDDALGHRFVEAFRLRSRVQLNAGDPFPIPQRPLKEIFARELGTNPDRMGVPIDGLRHLRIVQTTGHGHEIWLSLEHENALADFAAASRVAVLIPSDLRDLEWNITSHEGHPTFHDVRPRDGAQQTANVLSLLEKARGQAEIVVLPELCLDAASLVEIRRWYAESGAPFAMLVCGSIHVKLEGEQGRRNISTTLLAGGGTVEHAKFNPFSLVLQDETGKKVEHREGIVTVPSRITLYLCGSWSFTTLICKDFLEAGAMQILEELRPGLILVPACSPKTQPFETEAQHLALRAQALVVVANLTDPPTQEPAPTSAIFVKPLNKTPVEVVSRAALDLPALHIFQVGPPARKRDR